MNTIKLENYRRKMFNYTLLECFGRIQESCCEINASEEPLNAERAKKMSDAFYTDLLTLNSCTIGQTKKNLSEAVTFIQDVVSLAEAVADDKASTAAENDMEIPENQKIELNAEDEALIDKLFNEKNPDVQISAVRDATVKSLLAEDKKAQEIKDSLSIAQSQVAANGGDSKTMEETVSRLGNVGPTSLMNAIMNATAAMAIKDVNENAKGPVAIGTVMSENAQEIRNRAIMMYSLYEQASVFGIHKYTPKEIQHIAESIYYGK
jgi:hypothetical protein